ncbi:hypothetical protein [Salipiger mucosus]|uniref:Uncharacterized protein n=1 Tax=Salipiger mucosus DSM 16094 TaxID=1123237 RepID=S9S3I5_9RHOB|nr:hypothetical protein [Salipiger mucosus]EPX84760.1 hypothetical protein Salmuc_01333 [Salipiger mucosus DSM 16094]
MVDDIRKHYSEFPSKERLAEMRDTLAGLREQQDADWILRNESLADKHAGITKALALVDDPTLPVGDRIDVAIANLQELRRGIDAYDPREGERIQVAMRVVLIDTTLEIFAGIDPPEVDLEEPAPETAPFAPS